MKETTRLLGFLLLLALFAGGGFLFGRKTAPRSQESQVIVRTDTCIVVDTLCVSTPVFRYSYIHDTVRTYFTTLQHDTVQVDVPIERRIYAEDSVYRAVVSGPSIGQYGPSLDTISVYQRTKVITVTNNVRIPPPRWSWGVQAGVGVNAGGSVTPYLGIGIQYRLGDFEIGK